VNLANLTVMTTPNHFSSWAILSPQWLDKKVFLPLIMK